MKKPAARMRRVVHETARYEPDRRWDGVSATAAPCAPVSVQILSTGTIALVLGKSLTTIG